MQKNLTLVLDSDTGPVEILVWHQVMLNASPYFRNLLDPDRFAEGRALQKTGQARIALPETNAQAMQIICDVFHLNAKRIPLLDISSDQLFEIAVLTDKFDCGEVLQPWCDRWMSQKHIYGELQTIRNTVEQAPLQDLTKWIHICHVLGDSANANKITSGLIMYHTVDELDDTSSQHLRPSVVETMRDQQTKIITALHSVVTRFADLVEEGSTCQYDDGTRRVVVQAEYNWGNYDEANNIDAATYFHCTSVLLGNFLFAAKRELGAEWRVLSSWTGSIAYTHQAMQNMAQALIGPSYVVRRIPQKRSNQRVLCHDGCSMKSRFSDEIKIVMRMLDME